MPKESELTNSSGAAVGRTPGFNPTASAPGNRPNLFQRLGLFEKGDDRTVPRRLIDGFVAAGAPQIFAQNQQDRRIREEQELLAAELERETQAQVQKQVEEKLDEIKNSVQSGDLDEATGLEQRNVLLNELPEERRKFFNADLFKLSPNVVRERNLEQEAEANKQRERDEKADRQQQRIDIARDREDRQQEEFNFKKTAKQINKEQKKGIAPASKAFVSQVSGFLKNEPALQALDEEEKNMFAIIVANDIKAQQKQGVSFTDALNAANEKFKPIITETKNAPNFFQDLLGLDPGSETGLDLTKVGTATPPVGKNNSRNIITVELKGTGEVVKGFLNEDGSLTVTERVR